MTAQVTEALLIDGERLSMQTHPLEPWFVLAGIRSPFVCAVTWNRRGYRGTWELVSDRLYLVGLSGTFSPDVPDLDFSEGSVATLFPDFPERVFAHWYTGTLLAGGAALIAAPTVRGPAVHERTVFIDVERGRVTGRTERRNAPAPGPADAGTPAPSSERGEPR